MKFRLVSETEIEVITGSLGDESTAAKPMQAAAKAKPTMKVFANRMAGFFE